MTAHRPDVAVLGGGMAGLAAAWHLSQPSHRGRVGEITVYQRGWRLGGKAASHRGVHDRIEEHGLHVWLGYYDNAFRMIRECYDELDRTARDPTCPIQTWRDAFMPAPLIGLEDLHDGDWRTWTAWFPLNDRLPGEPIDDVCRAAEAPTAVDFLARSVGLMRAFVESLDSAATDLLPGVAFAAGREAERLFDRLAAVVPAAEVPRAIAAAVARATASAVHRRDGSRRLWQLVDLVSAQLRGLLADDLVRRGFSSIDDVEYRDWIRRHGASEETCRGALVRGLYDLAFSHRGGDPSDTAFPAGLGLLLATKTFFDYRGALFWKMSAGMGDTVIAPIYQALRRRGVRFEFFHRVDDVQASRDGSRVERIVVGRQVDLRPGLETYEPLVRYGGLDCFPASPLVDQLDASEEVRDARLESFWCSWPDADRITLERGRDFDEVVFAIPVGMAPFVTADLARSCEPWRRMLDTVETIGTRSVQLWLRRSEAELGSESTGSTVSSFVAPFDTYSSMSHLIGRESWPDADRPAAIVYLCSSLPDGDSDQSDPLSVAHARVLADAVEYVDHRLQHYLPGAADDEGFDWTLLCGTDASGAEALASQHISANVDPSDRYVQAMPGTGMARLPPDDSTVRHFHLAGDWTRCGLDAGCIEAAVLSGIQAANSVLGVPRWSGVTGGWA